MQSENGDVPAVLITGPHADCGSALVRDCDERAGLSARLLQEALARRNVRSDLYLATTFRAQDDLNRPWTRSSAWRRRVLRRMREIAALYPGTGWLLDMHSFPRGTPNFNGEVVLLTHPRGDNEPLWRLASGLRSAGIDVAVISGSEINDLQEQARELGLRSALVEVVESGIPEARYGVIANAISDFIYGDLLMSRIFED